jgi:hypothetical protein
MVLLCFFNYDKEIKQTRRVGKCGIASPESPRFSPGAGSELTSGALNQTADGGASVRQPERCLPQSLEASGVEQAV